MPTLELWTSSGGRLLGSATGLIGGWVVLGLFSGCWAVGLFGCKGGCCWAVGLLGCWLGCVRLLGWAVEVLGRLLLGCWAVALLGWLR